MTSGRHGWVVIVHGPPTSGKSTQSERAAGVHDAAHISSGELLRGIGNAGSAAVMAAGGISPTGPLLDALEAAIRRVPPDQPIILDGVTRRDGEPAWLLRLLEELDRPLVGVIRLAVCDETCFARASQRQGASSRADDNPGVQQARLKNFRDLTAVTLGFYGREGYLTIEGSSEGDPDFVARQTELALDALLYVTLRRVTN